MPYFFMLGTVLYLYLKEKLILIWVTQISLVAIS